MGIGISGLIADARVLAHHMRGECLNHKYVFDSNMPIQRLVTQVSDKAQVFTQTNNKRPYGVGLLVVGVDKTGPHLFQTQPSGNFGEYHAMAIGARAQSAKTYLENNFDTFDDLKLEELIKHALTALKSTSQEKLTARGISLGYVGTNTPFTLLDDDDISPYLDEVQAGDDSDDDDEEDGMDSTA